MPELKIPKNMILFPGMEILSLMAYPNDEEARKILLANVSSKMKGEYEEIKGEDLLHEDNPERITKEGLEGVADMLNKGVQEETEKVFSEMGGISALHDSPEYKKVKKQYNENGHKGRIAGLILSYIWRMEVSGVLRPSVNKAVFLVNKLFGGSAIKSLPFSETFMRKAWTDFKSVAHLHAAFLEWTIWGKPEEYSPAQPLGIHGFISLAEKFREFGITFKPTGQNNPILLNDETWFPSKNFNSRDFKLKIPPLSPEELRRLKEYRAPIIGY